MFKLVRCTSLNKPNKISNIKDILTTYSKI
nr:MAG TPA: hypothetical protein [Caudoviricetes sp.]